MAVISPMRHCAFAVVVAAFICAGSVIPADAAADPQIKTTLDQYCVACHNPRLKTGGFVLATSSLDHVPANRIDWERVVRKLRLAVMPPLGSRRPDEATYERVIASLEG